MERSLGRIEALFTEDAVAHSCSEMSFLEKISAEQRFGPA
jgi:hypothetical protein